jgi:uncharacterized RDD family membrane protein YckC
VVERHAVHVYADVPNRLLGILLDAVLLSLLAFLGAAALSLAFGPVVRFDLDTYVATVDRGLAAANAVLTLVLGCAYFVLSYLLLHASPGHRLLGMTLHGEDGQAPLSLRAALVRWLLLAAPFGVASIATTLLTGIADAGVVTLAAAYYLVLLVTTGLHPAKQGLHDRVAGTVTVKRAAALAPAASVAD